MIFYSNGSNDFNTTAPTGALADSGWQYQAEYDLFLATPIARHYYICADHVASASDKPIVLNGVTSQTVAVYKDPSSDLEIGKVDRPFPVYAPLYTNSNETGKDIVVFGRGRRRGNEIKVGSVLKGWLHGGWDTVQRWGENQVNSIVSTYLYCTFDAGAGTNECHLADKDSSGGVFIEEAGKWKLAGINYSVDVWHHTNSTGTGFAGAIFDEGGLYTSSSQTGPWSLEPDTGPDKPTGFYSTRISSRMSWITNVIADEYDRDHDYIPDVWEAQYSASPTGLTASADEDDDGYSNFDEFVANTSPTNAASFPGVVHTRGDTNLWITFVSATDRTYRVEQSPNTLGQGALAWSPVSTNVYSGTGELTTVVVTNDLSQTGGLYRLGVFLP